MEDGAASQARNGSSSKKVSKYIQYFVAKDLVIDFRRIFKVEIIEINNYFRLSLTKNQIILHPPTKIKCKHLQK